MTDTVTLSAERLAREAERMHQLAQAAEVARAQAATWPAVDRAAAEYVEKIAANALARSAASVIARTRGLAESMGMGRAN